MLALWNQAMMLYRSDNRLSQMLVGRAAGRLRDADAQWRAGSVNWPNTWQGPGTLATWLGYGAGNPRFFVSGRFTSLVNCGELVNPLNSLGELDFSL